MRIPMVKLCTRVMIGVLIVTAAFIPPRRAAAQSDFSSPRNADVDARGARSIRVEAGAGLLRVEGRPGITQVRVRGTAHASRQAWLDEIRLVAERRGADVFIKADIPDRHGSLWNMFGDHVRALDLVIEVPTTIPLDVVDSSGESKFIGTGSLDLEDGSGDVEIRGAKGSVRVNDGSGNVVLSGIEGDVTVDDGSGNIDASNITGNFTVEEDGSGNIHVNGIGGTMRVRDDGSGDIDVDRIAGDFVVDHDGGGSIRYNTVTGSVSIPDRKRRRSE